LAKISTYVIDGSIVDGDKVIGSDANNDMITKNYRVGDLVSYFAASIGNNYLVPYLGANDDVDLGSFNLIASNVQISNSIIAGGTVGNAGQVLMSQGPGLPSVWAFNAGSQGLNSVLNNGNASVKNINLVNAFGTAIIDIEKVYGDAAIYLSDLVNSFNSYWKPEVIHLEDSNYSVNYATNKIRYQLGSNYVDLIPTNYNNQTIRFPTNGGVLPVSVNGVFANMSGDISIPTSGGTVTSVGVTSGTGISASVTNPTTTPNITITNTAPDQTVVLNSGTGISVTGTYPNFTIAATGGGVPNLQSVLNAGNSATDKQISLTDSVSNITSILGSVLQFNDNTNSYQGIYESSGFSLYNVTTANSFSLSNSGLFPVIFYNASTLNFPTASGTFALSVNGVGAAADGSITIPVGTGTVTGVTATSPITSSGGTAPVISTSMATNKLIGRSTAGTGVMEEISIGTGLSLSAGTLSSTAAGILHGTASGTDTYTVTIAGATAYADGDAYLIRFPNGNTTGATLNINGFGAVTLYRNNDGPVIGGDIWNGSEMLCIYNSTTVGFQLIGTSPNAMYAYITNADSVTITKGQVVYAFGGQGDRMTVKLANNSSDATSAQTVGVVLSTSIAANQKGVIITQGLLDGLSILPTSTYNDGDPLFLGSTAGSVTNIKPYAPNHLVYLGNVTTASNGAAGRWYVRVQNGYELDELHNVQAKTPSVNDVLYYFGGSPGQWKTASISSVLGYTPVGGSGTTNELAYFTGASTIGSLTTATYPSLTELSYVKGVTSSIQTQLNNRGYTLTVTATQYNPVDGTTVYFANQGRIPTTSSGIQRLYIPQTGTIKSAYITSICSTIGTNENISLSIRRNDTTDTLIATVGNTNQPREFINTSLNISVTAGDYIEIKVVNPTFATNPVNMSFGGSIYIQTP
jgi:hypothetical protein